jgi:hypothetical protein
LDLPYLKQDPRALCNTRFDHRLRKVGEHL